MSHKTSPGWYFVPARRPVEERRFYRVFVMRETSKQVWVWEDPQHDPRPRPRVSNAGCYVQGESAAWDAALLLDQRAIEEADRAVKKATYERREAGRNLELLYLSLARNGQRDPQLVPQNCPAELVAFYERTLACCHAHRPARYPLRVVLEDVVTIPSEHGALFGVAILFPELIDEPEAHEWEYAQSILIAARFDEHGAGPGMELALPDGIHTLDELRFHIFAHEWAHFCLWQDRQEQAEDAANAIADVLLAQWRREGGA